VVQPTATTLQFVIICSDAAQENSGVSSPVDIDDRIAGARERTLDSSRFSAL
jgi:hypothetical protein